MEKHKYVYTHEIMQLAIMKMKMNIWSSVHENVKQH